jgi:hypothetical protein
MTEKTLDADVGRPSRTAAIRRKATAKSEAAFLDSYALELARGGAHIASALTPDTITLALHDVMDEFTSKHGCDNLGVFLGLLALRLDARMARCAADIVRTQLGEQPEKTPPTTRRQSKRKAVADRRENTSVHVAVAD